MNEIWVIEYRKTRRSKWLFSQIAEHDDRLMDEKKLGSLPQTLQMRLDTPIAPCVTFPTRQESSHDKV